VDEDASLIGFIPQTFDQTSINQLDGTMMPKLESLGQLTDRCFPPGGQSLERKQQLVLLRHETFLARRLFAKVQKMPNLKANFG